MRGGERPARVASCSSRAASAAGAVAGVLAGATLAGGGSRRRVSPSGKGTPAARSPSSSAVPASTQGTPFRYGLLFQREHHLGVLGVAAAGRAVEGVDQLPLVEEDLPRGLQHGPVGERVLDVDPAVDLAARSGADVVPLAGELADVLQGVGAGGDRLCLERLDLGVLVGPHLRGDDPAEVLLEGQLVDEVQGAAVVQEDEDAAVVAVPLGPDGTPLAVDRHPAPGEDGGRRPLDEPEGRGRDLRSLRDHPGAGHPHGPEALRLALGLLAGGEAAEPDAVEVDPGVEMGIARLAGLALQALGELLGLVLVAERGDLQPVEARLGGPGGGLDAHRLNHGEDPVVGGDRRLPRAAGEGDRSEVARQADPDPLRVCRVGGCRGRRGLGSGRSGRSRRGGGGDRWGRCR